MVVEGAPPAPSVWIEERASHLARLEPLFAAAAGGDTTAIVEALRHAPRLVRGGLMKLNGRLPGRGDATHLTFETGLRITSLTRVPIRDEGRRLMVDIWPETRYSTAADDPAAAWRHTLDHSTRLARVEAGVATTTAVSLLDGAALRRTRTATLEADLSDFTPELREEWRNLTLRWNEHTLVLPETGDPRAFFAVHDRGSVISVLPGGGGPGESYEWDREYVNEVFDAIGALEAPGLEVWAELERTKLLILSHVTELLDTGSTNWAEEIEDSACDAIGEAIADAIPGAGEAKEALEMAEELGGYLAPEGTELPDPGIPCL